MPNRTLGRVTPAVLLACVGLLSGCVEVMKRPADFNEMLGDGASAPKISCLSVQEGKQTCVLPGMKLLVLQTDEGLNTQQYRSLVESRTEWTIPSVNSFSQEDLFHLSWLLSVSASDDVVDPSLCYQKWLEEAPYPDTVQANFMSMVINTLNVEILNPVAHGGENAGDVQDWMRRITHLHSPGERYEPRQVLTYAIPLLDPTHTPAGTPADCVHHAGEPQVQLRAFQSGSPFQREPGAKPAEPGQTLAGHRGWYSTANTVEARAYLSVLVPVTVAGQAGILYEPIDSSLADIAADLGRPLADLVGVRRNKKLIPVAKIPSSQSPDLSKDSVVIDGTTDDDALPLSSDVLVERGMFRDLLVAPHDEIIFRNLN